MTTTARELAENIIRVRPEEEVESIERMNLIMIRQCMEQEGLK